MGVSIQTNKGKVSRGVGHNVLTDQGRVVIVGDTNGDKAYVPYHALCKKGINMGPTFQANSAVQIDLTLDPVELASDPLNDARITWKAWNTFVAGDIVACPLLFSVARITFTVKGTVNIVSV